MMKRIAVLLLILLLSTSAFTEGSDAVVADEQAERGAGQSGITALDDLAGKRIGVQTGTNFDAMVEENVPGAKVEYYNTKADLVAALTGQKVDAFAVDEPVAQLLMRESDRLTYLPGYLDSYEFAAVFQKGEAGEALRDQFDAFLAQLPGDALDGLAAKWFGDNEDEKTMPDVAALPAKNGTLRLATESGYMPFEYVRDGAVVGYDMELAALFCEYGGFGLEIVDMSFDGILPSVQTGKCDFAVAGISVTPERAESVLFSKPYFSGGTVCVVMKDGQTPTPGAGESEYTQSSDLSGETVSYGAGEPIRSFADLENRRIGAVTGSVQVQQLEARFPEAGLFYFNTTVDMLNALRTHRIDAFAEGEPLVKYLMTENQDLTYLDERLGDGMQIGAVFPMTEDGKALCDQFSAFIREIRQNGVYDEIQGTWFGTDESKRVVPDPDTLPATNGTLRMATDTTLVPFVYVKDGKPMGLEIDTAVRFCEAYGYGLEVVPMDFSGIIPSIVAEKVDFACSCIAYTPERAQSVLYSESTYESGSVIAILKEQEPQTVVGAGETSPWGGIASSFDRTFLRENRWRLFVDGVLTTLLITVLTILLGTILGFAVFMLCRNGNPVANLVTRFCTWLVQGMPMVVLLMILYYVIFGSVAINGVAVAVIGFTLTFGAAVLGLLKMGVGAVDNGQYEAACALGYSGRRTFYRIILPQALPHVLPAYKGEIVGLIKATAIVGYIAVQDLTKMGDIVRSRTYEAFFPLIAVTVIYFVLEGLIGFLVNRISLGFNPKRRKATDILKGVKTDD